jgi:tetratricopeptide (TPR) repeat protein
MNQPKKLTRKEKEALSRQTAVSSPKKTRQPTSPFFSLPSVLVFVFGFLLYAGTISYEYTLDDFAAINSNRYVQAGAAGIGDILHTAYWSGYIASNNTLYRPVPLILFALEWQFFPNNPAAGHFMNVLLYAFSGVLLFRLLNKLFKDNLLLSFAATLLFLAHPVHTEAVANIKSCDEILCLLFCIVSLSKLLDYHDTGKGSALAGSALAFFLALLSKENAITWLAVIPLAFILFRQASPRKALTLAIPHAGMAILFLAILTGIQHGMLVTRAEHLTNNILAAAPDTATRLATAILVLGKYLWLLVFPLHLSMDYSFAAIRLVSFTDIPVLISLGILLLLVAAGIYAFRKKNVLGFCILYFFVTISLVSNIVFVIGTVMADRLLYMPSLALAIALAWLLTKIRSGTGAPARDLAQAVRGHSLAAGLCAVLLVAYSVKTLARTPVWKNNHALFTSGIEDEPENAYAHYLYSNELIRSVSNGTTNAETVYREALEHYQKAVSIDTTNASFYNEVAATYRKLKNTDAALAYYDKALKYNSRLPQAYNGKGVLLFQEKRYREAVGYFSESVKLNPMDATTLLNLGSCYLVLGDNANAITYLGKSLQYNPNDATALKYMGFAYQNTGDQKMAQEYFSKSSALEKK